MEHVKSCLICSAHQTWKNSSWWVTLSLMRARIWIRPVLVFWRSILLYRREKSWLLVKVLHLNSASSSCAIYNFVIRENQPSLDCYSAWHQRMRTAIALGRQQCLPSFLFKYWGGRSGRHRGTGPQLPSRLHSLKRKTKKCTLTI